ncbi:MAG: ABC transporter ATP-binding protein [Coriobacteriia bacterium]|nr:ABC transporter ATP-binding protein [Coriobacteriia bacterium]MBN2821619.1 ABC transporter ATP-binding protein [Coriobacteriia bacterium]
MIELKNVQKHLGVFHLKDINLAVEPGEYFVILGATGTGKTLILETIAGLYRPDGGSISHAGRDLQNVPPEERDIGFVYQDYALFPHLSVGENIGFGLKLRKQDTTEIRAKVEQIAGLFGIAHLLDRYPGTLSGGEQQRAAIARALMVEPRILLLDEPLSALDPRSKESFKRELKRVHQLLKPTVIHVTHDFSVALSLADRIALMHDGSIVQVGTPTEVFRRPCNRALAEFVGMENIYMGLADGADEVVLNEGLRVAASCGDRSGQVNLAVRPEDILLSYEELESSARNSFKGTVTEVALQGVLARVTVDVGVPLVSFVTTQSLEQQDLAAGAQVWATFKSSSVHVF